MDLKKLNKAVEKKIKRMSKQIIRGHEIVTDEAGGGKWKVTVDGHDLPGKYSSNSEAIKEGREFVEEHFEKEMSPPMYRSGPKEELVKKFTSKNAGTSEVWLVPAFDDYPAKYLVYYEGRKTDELKSKSDAIASAKEWVGLK